jgi:hypothetical protein
MITVQTLASVDFIVYMLLDDCTFPFHRLCSFSWHFSLLCFLVITCVHR